MIGSAKNLCLVLCAALVAGCGFFRGLSDPQVQVSRPSTNDVVVPGATFAIAYSAEALGGTVALYYGATSLACEASALSNWTPLATGLAGGAQTYDWNTTAVATGSYAVCAVATDPTGKVSYGMGSALRINVAPTIAVTSPSVANAQVATNGTYAINYVAVDPDDDATVTLYYKTANTNCTDGSLTGWTQIATATESAGTYSWNLTGLAVGNYYVCARITDGIAAAAYSVSAGYAHLNAVPTFAFSGVDGTFRLAGASSSVSYTAADSDDAATFALYLMTTSSGTCSSAGLSLVTGLPEGASSWSHAIPLTQNSGVYYLCAVISDGTNSPVQVFSGAFTIYHHCTWLGGSTVWSAPANWSNCNSVAPQSVDVVNVPSGGNQPTLSSSTTIAGFTGASGGGIITVAAGTTLSMANYRVMDSSIGFQGDSSSCSTCRVEFGSYNTVNLTNGMTFTLLAGISIGGIHTINVGSGTTYANLVVTGGATSAEWPMLGYSATINVQGTSSNRSSVTFDGARLAGFVSGLRFVSYYTIQQMDRVDFTGAYAPNGLFSASTVRVEACSTGQINDLTWSALGLNNLVAHGVYNIDVNTCSGMTINVSGSGKGYGPKAARDPAGVLSWANGTSFTCTWTGTTNTAWNDSTNWSGCANGRNGYPDLNDSVIIPSGPGNQPVLSTSEGVFGFASGAGGGTLTINGSRTLVLYGSGIASSVKLTSPGVGTRTDVFVREGLAIANDATLTLGHGVYSTIYSGYIALGDGSSAGNLATDADPGRANWPTIDLGASNAQGIQVTNGGAQPSAVTLDGLNVINRQFATGAGIWNFVSNFRIAQFDHVEMQFVGGVPLVDYLTIATCAGSFVDDLTWSEMGFLTPLTTAHNVNIANCASLGTQAIRITPPSYSAYASRGGYASKALDPDNVVLFDGMPLATGTATYVGTDTTSRGTWIGRYGSSGYSIAASSGSIPAGVTFSTDADLWTWATTTTDLRAPQLPPTGATRTATAYYSNNTLWFADYTAATATNLTIYMLDWENSPRSAIVEVFDSASGALLDTRTVAAYANGVYLTWRIQGAVTLRFTKTSSQNAAMSAFFFDP